MTPPSQHEKLSDSLTNISFEIGASLAIIKALINLEFQRKHQHPFTILRVNSIVSKMIGKYSKKVGEEYLRKLLVNLVNDIYSREGEDWELEKERMTGDEAKADGVAKKRENLKGKTFEEIESQILERSMDHLMKNLTFNLFKGFTL